MYVHFDAATARNRNPESNRGTSAFCLTGVFERDAGWVATSVRNVDECVLLIISAIGGLDLQSTAGTSRSSPIPKVAVVKRP